MMAASSAVWFFQDGSSGCLGLAYGSRGGKLGYPKFQTPFLGAFQSKNQRIGNRYFGREGGVLPCIKCVSKDGKFDPLSVERPPYHIYYDSTSGQLEPASGARASIPGQELWPEGTIGRVRAARAPEPTGVSEGKPSYGKNPGSRRRKNKGQVSAAAAEASETSSNIEISEELSDTEEVLGAVDDASDEPRTPMEQYVIYQTEPEEENLSTYEMDKRLGLPHSFINPANDKPIEEPRSSEELWWNWRKNEKEQWSRWQRRRPDVDTVFAKAMAETGQIKLYGEHPTITEAALARARRHIFKEERLQAEQRRLEEIGPIAYYSEWVKAWVGDASHESIQKHYEETGEDENMQLITMFEHQTAEEYRIMMGTDVRVQRDPLAMRMREDQIKEIWGGDPVYPTVNYIQDPDEVIDYRGPDFHEPTPNMLAYLMDQGKIISREELEEILTKEKKQEVEVTDIDDAMASAVDIGENDDDEDSEDEEVNEEDEVEEKITRNWSVLKSTPQLQKSKEKPKESKFSLEEAIGDSENLTDFLMDFDEEE